jgi:phenylalanyl-tRNA synthetase beta chain
VVLANPIASQMGVMRSTLIGGLVGTLAANRKRQIDRVRVFEIGRCFRREAGAGPVDGFAQPCAWRPGRRPGAARAMGRADAACGFL